MSDMMMSDMTVAPQIKAVSDTMGSAFDEFMEAFEAFRETNDRRLDEMDRKMSGDVVTREKLERIDKALDDSKKRMDELQLKQLRPGLGGARHNGFEDSEHKAAFEAYIRRGEEGSLRDIEAKSLSAGVAGDGGYLVPPEVDSEIGKRLSALSPMRGLASVQQVSGAVLKKPFMAGGMSAAWVAETASRSQTNTGALSELSFPTMELYAMPAASQMLLDDAAVDVEAWIAQEVNIAFAEQEGTAFITGDGSAKPKGILSYTTVANDSWAADKIGFYITGANGAFGSSGPMDVLIDTIYALKAGHRQNGTFLMNRKTQGALRRIKDTSGNYIWHPPAAAGEPATLMGYPLQEAEAMPDMATDSFSIAFGDFKSAYLIVDRVGVRVLRDPYSAKPYVLFYTTKRVGGGIQNFEALKLIKFSAPPSQT